MPPFTCSPTRSTTATVCSRASAPTGTERGPAVFRLREHIERLFRSAKILFLDIPYDVNDLVAATLDTVRANGHQSCYIRPLVYLGYGEMGLNPLSCSVDVSIATWPWGTYLGTRAWPMVWTR
ncbi:MAG: hypothetical protein CM1200mP26_23000 [Acidimicrobiales bacterium]|nr:MAG: hypothetical protein CM1200mP26_23000 [Acidimicrobiales bacterium]